jgi:hypothetical protein
MLATQVGSHEESCHLASIIATGYLESIPQINLTMLHRIRMMHQQKDVLDMWEGLCNFESEITNPLRAQSDQIHDN